MPNLITKTKKKVIDKTLIPSFYILKSKISRKNKIKVNGISVLNTSLNSDNLGDQIINLYCAKILEELDIAPNEQIATHSQDEKIITNKDLKLITGTNLLNSTMNEVGVWQHPQDFTKINNVGLMGVGWGLYAKKPNYYTRIFLNSILSSTFIHSVRDSYTLSMLSSIGITNVLNTACPTMWKLTNEFCATIPNAKANEVVTTITDYDRNTEMDFKMLDILLRNYNKVYVWIQGQHDLEYLQKYSHFNSLVVVENTLDAYTDLLKKHDSLDYIGTRLHAGIHALNHKKRSIIISIDNRAAEIAKDTNLPIIERDKVLDQLETKINNQIQTDIHLPIANINKWKKQFTKN